MDIVILPSCQKLTGTIKYSDISGTSELLIIHLNGVDLQHCLHALT